MNSRTRPVFAAVGVVLLLAPGVLAQPRASERGATSQIVNSTTITLDFGRPVARGRDNLFGGVIHWGETWTPGANWATTLEVDRPILLDGNRVEPGKYSVWLQPRERDSWTLLLNSEWRLYHDSPFPADQVVLTFPVSPERGAHMEALNWYVHAISPRTATLRMHWGPTFVELDIETEQYNWDPLPPGERAAYLGSYAFDTNDPTTGGPLRLTIGVLEENDRLVGRWGRAPIALVPAGPAEFMIGFLRNGDLFDVADEMTLRILVEDGVSTGAVLLWEGQVFGRGEKVGR